MHIIRFLKSTSKIFQNCPLQSKFQQITQIPHSSPIQSANYAKLAHFVNIFYYVSGTCPGREPCRIPVNYANSVQFAHTVRELREIRTICSDYTLRFRCLTSGRERREIPANQAKSAQFTPICREFRTLRTKINTYVIDFQISDHRQRTQGNWSESTRFRSIRPPITRIM